MRRIKPLNKIGQMKKENNRYPWPELELELELELEFIRALSLHVHDAF